jgi:hypothetical protein
LRLGEDSIACDLDRPIGWTLLSKAISERGHATLDEL